MNNLYQVLETTTMNYPENTALAFGTNKISYQKVKEAVDRLASGLKLLGLEPGNRIALMLPNVPHFPISYFALLKIGVIVVPISILNKAEEIHYQLDDSEVNGIIYWQGFRNNVIQSVRELERCKKIIVLGDKVEKEEIRLTYLIEKNDPMEETVEVKLDDTALIAYTAGTTGPPKGVELAHGNILFDIDACSGFLKLGPEDSSIGVIPLYHPLGHTLIMGTFFRVGARIALMPKFDCESVFKMLEEERPSYFAGVPSMYKELLKKEYDPEFNMDFLKFCLSSGDALDQETLRRFEERFKVVILEGYGLTEASPMVSMNSPTQERKPGSIGFPLPGIEMKIVDESDSEVKPSQVGEIVVKGPNVMKGYLNKPEITEVTLKDRWLRTGDLALLDENGFGFIVVRKKNVIVKSGFNIYPSEVEKFLYDYPKIKEVVVVGVPDSIYGEEIHACIVLKEGEEATQEEIVEYTKEHMAAYKCPSTIYFCDSLPKGPTGRVLRDKIMQGIIEKKNTQKMQ